VWAEQEAGEHEQAGDEHEDVPGEEHGDLLLQDDVVVHPPELVDEGDRPADGLHDPEDAEAATGRNCIAEEGDDESEEEQGGGDVAGAAEGDSTREKGGGDELNGREGDRGDDPEFGGLTHYGPHFSRIDYRPMKAKETGQNVVVRWYFWITAGR